MTRGRRWLTLLSVVLLASGAEASCSSSKHGSTSGTTGPAVTSQSTSAASLDTCTPARTGGNLTFAEFLQPTTLDPANPSDARGVIGGSEMAAIYDTLIQYDTQTGKFVSRAAQSLTSNADASEWTLKLRPGVKFGSGDPLNSEAVKVSIQRHLDPKLASAEKVFASNIADIQTPDDLTVVFKLTGPWVASRGSCQSVAG